MASFCQFHYNSSGSDLLGRGVFHCLCLQTFTFSVWFVRDILWATSLENLCVVYFINKINHCAELFKFTVVLLIDIWPTTWLESLQRRILSTLFLKCPWAWRTPVLVIRNSLRTNALLPFLLDADVSILSVCYFKCLGYCLNVVVAAVFACFHLFSYCSVPLCQYSLSFFFLCIYQM